MPLRDGAYDHVVTHAIEAELDPSGRRFEVDALDPADSHLRLARHLAVEVEQALRSLPAEGRVDAQVALANELLRVLRERLRALTPDAEVAAPGRLLKAVYRIDPPPRPSTPLALSTLLTRGRADPALGHELAHEIGSADEIDVIVSFIMMGGLRQLMPALRAHAEAGRPLRVVTTTYMGTTDAAAVEQLAGLRGATVKVSYDGRRTRLHAKAWLFRRATGLSTAYIGSANLSRAALFGGHEWMVRVSAADLPHVIAKFEGSFQSLWEDPEFETYSGDADHQKLARALRQEASAQTTSLALVDVRPYPFQQEILDRLDAERRLHGRTRNLVVAATGTGKTVVAALDYRRVAEGARARPRLLVVAHRMDILVQARDTFRHALHDESFGELLGDGHEPASHHHVFAMIQTLARRHLLERLGVEHFEHVVVDECHHAPAASYRAVLERLRPKILVGLTATPERSDGQLLLPDFDNHVAAEIRLWHAIERQLLVPFEYFGLHDGVDLTRARWSRGGYHAGDLDNLYTGHDRRAALVVEQLRQHVGSIDETRALGFCVSVAHAEFMARRFTEMGIPAVAVHGDHDSTDRSEAKARLRDGQLKVLFTCDLFNEGVDLPWLNTVLLLRPTESATLFLQQIGRGLRHHRETQKPSCLVLDFIGQHRAEFRFDRLLGALTGTPRGRIPRELEEGFPTLPSGCSLQLDRVARDLVLANIRHTLRGGLRRLTEDLRGLIAIRGGDVSLRDFVAESGRDFDELYRAGGWTALRRNAGLIDDSAPEGEREANQKLERIVHADDPERITAYVRAISGEASLGSEERLRLMLGYQLTHDRNVGVLHASETFSPYPALRSEARELGDLLADITVRRPIYPVAGWPLALHCRYERREILAAVGAWTAERRRTSIEGVFALKDDRVELFFVTLDKSDKGFTPTTRYEDYAISPRQFHWQSQGRTSPTSMVGRRYSEQASNGWRFFLFVQPRKDTPYVFLGPVRYASHTGDRPMSIVWQLDHEMPADIFEELASLLPG